MTAGQVLLGYAIVGFGATTYVLIKSQRANGPWPGSFGGFCACATIVWCVWPLAFLAWWLPEEKS